MSEAIDLLPEFRVRFPEFDSVSDARVTVYIEDSFLLFYSKASDTPNLYLTAHLLALDSSSGAGQGGSGAGVDGGGGGEMTSQSVGSMSASFKAQSDKAGDSFYATTAYGRRFLAYKQTMAAFSVRVG